ncbi:MAG: hypothetical protein D6738_14440 [Acidobacteria bacterium]|nr:MAG: hypothetical protein D6738_14440 [Acidobacteriota bacterium]
MSLQVANWFRRPARRDADTRRRVRACPGCGAPRSEARPAGVEADGGPWACPRCGTLADASGRALVVEPAGGRLVPADDRAAGAVPVGGTPPGRAQVAERVLRALLDAGAVEAQGALGDYLDAVRTRVGGPPRAPMLLLDEGDPRAMPLPGAGTVLSLGLLAALEDEAQLAFVLAREASLARAGWPDRRFARVLAEASRWRVALRPGRGAAELRREIELSLRVGWGPDAEGAADDDAIRRVRGAGYDVAAAVRALSVIERSGLPGRSVRFLIDEARRRKLLVESSRPAAPGRVDREVYRRAVGGFAIFSAVRGR